MPAADETLGGYIKALRALETSVCYQPLGVGRDRSPAANFDPVVIKHICFVQYVPTFSKVVKTTLLQMIQQPWRTVVFDVSIIFNIWNILNILLNASKFRWASIRGFDWAGELLTLDLPGEPNSVQQTTWHVMVARMRLVLAWAPKPGDLAPRVLDWTLVIPPIIVRSPASADIYYALFHSPHTRPLMLARFVMMQQA